MLLSRVNQRIWNKNIQPNFICKKQPNKLGYFIVPNCSGFNLDK